ncbi:MAG: YlbF family regulator [Chloroflexota bacterium]
MQSLQDFETDLTIDDQLDQIERLAAVIRALPEYNGYWEATKALYADPGANCRRDELPMRLYQARKHHQPLTDDFCGRESVQAFVHAEVELSQLLSGVERLLSRATGIALCEDIDLEDGPETFGLPDAVRREVDALGEMLAHHPAILAYQAAAGALAADRHASELDLRFETIRLRLKTRQRAMEDLRTADVKAFHKLREDVLVNPLIDKRDRALEEAHHYLGRVADTLNRKLSLDFLALARG